MKIFKSLITSVLLVVALAVPFSSNAQKERKSKPNVVIKVIGECEVGAVEGDDISLCKVKKGHKELKAALDEGQEIVLKSKPTKRVFF